MRAVAIASPGYPHTPGGVTDHTARLVRHWSALGLDVTVLGTIPPPEELPAIWTASGIGSVLIQYVPFLFGRRGISRFPERLARAARDERMRVVVFVHEPWVPPTRLPWLILSPLQRVQLRRLMKLCDAVITPVPAWQRMLGHDAQVLPVSSTLGDPPANPPAPLDAPLVFSPFAAGLAWDWIVAGVEAIDRGLVVVGADAITAINHPTVGRWADHRWDWRGRRTAPEVLEALMAAPLVLAPFVDGMTGRRTSALAAMSTGARTLSSEGPLVDPMYRMSPMRLAETREEFARLAAEWWHAPDQPESRAARVQWYRVHLDPQTLDRRLLEILTPQP